MLLPETAGGYRSAAWVLFDASVRWALEAPNSETGLALLSSGGDIEPLSLTGGSGTILLVVGDDLNLTASDQTYKARMEAMGFTVQVIKALNATAGSATNKKMVFVAGSSPNGDVGEKFRLVTVPVLVQNAGIVDQMNMTGAIGGVDRGVDAASTQAVVVTPTHVIAALLTGTQTISGGAGGQNWGIGNATTVQNVLRHTSNSTHATLFGYEQGAAMVGLNAPRRRVLFGFAGPIPETFTTVGGDIFDRTIFWATKTNIPPAVNAGPDQATTADANFTINGAVIDDGLPNPPGAFSVQWSVIQQAPNSQVTFVTSATAQTTTVKMNNTGTFVLRLSASDDNGSFWTTDDIVITVWGEDSNQTPVADAGPDRVFDLINLSMTLMGTATDDGLPNPPGELSLGWSKLSGPGTVTFGSPTEAVTTAIFSLQGTYVLRLTANDCDPALYPSACPTGGLTSYDDVVVSVRASAVLVVNDPVALTPSDSYVRSRIEALGFPIVFVAASTAQASQALNRAFVWVTHSSPSNSILDTFKDVTVPVVIESSAIVDDMLMTTGANRGSTANQTQGVLSFPPTSALSGGVVGTVAMNTTPINHDWGTPASAGVKVVTQVGNPSRATVFSYEDNAAMVGGFPAPDRRVFFGMWAFDTPTPEARRILDATILWVGRTNAPPWPNAGPDLAPTLNGPSVQVSLAGSVIDDVMPSPPVEWTRESGPIQLDGQPAPVTFGNISMPSTTATFTVAGEYVLKLTASDGTLSRSDTTVVNVLTPGANAAPTVAAGSDRTVKLPIATSLTALAGDDGLPNPTLTYAWTKVSGPGTVTFGTPAAKTTTATFSVSGIYVLRVTVNDGAASASDDVRVTVEAAAAALLVVGSTNLPAKDAALKARLEQFGMSVTVKGPPHSASDANNKVIAVISDTVDSNVLLATFRNTATPVLCQEPFVYDNMNMTGTAATNFGTVVGSQATITSSHALAAQLTGTVSTHTAAVSQAFGVPAASAIKVAVAPSDTTKALVFGYPEGVTMFAGDLVEGRRVGMFGEANVYTAEGMAIFDAAVTWLTEKRAPALLVTGSTTLTASDQAIKSRLLGLGYPTTTVTSAAVTSGSTSGMAVVFIAPSANATALGTKLQGVAVPVVTTGAAAFPNMALTGATSGTHFGTAAAQTKVAVTNPFHPLGAQLSGTRTVVSTANSFSWGVPGSSADVAATLELDAGKATIFGYEAGDVMVGVSAPERRVGLWLGPTSAQALTADGSVLVDAAIAWALASDGDRDGLGFLEEFRLGTSPADADSNDDGLLDGIATDSGVSPTATDIDGDGLTNAQELSKGTDAYQWDTDGDTVGDGADCFPLDSTRTCVPPTPGDVTPPGITLLEPTNAAFVSAVCTPSPCPP